MAQAQNFRVGFVVRTKTMDGPLMTVSEIRDNGVFCLWFDELDELHRGFFETNTLNLIKE